MAGDFSQATQIAQMGEQQIFDSTKSMLERERVIQHNPADYLQELHAGRITADVREEAILIVLQFAIQTDCLD